jgi:glycosyltransferase involved in cell wall biosynthesis
MQPVKRSIPVITVVICTYNRAELLATALQTLCQQMFEPSHYEVIVVDNNSRDKTWLVSQEFCQRQPNIRYCLELRQGLSYARNRGWREAKGEYVAYIDDECKVPAQWLAVAKQIIDRLAPAVFGGPFFGYYRTAKPPWWKEDYGGFEYSDVARALTPSEHISGGNLVIQRTVLDKLGGFSPELGMSGQKLGYGEETELQNRLRATMPDQLIYYDPNLYLYHLVRPEKMNLRWILYSQFIGGRYSYNVFHNNNPRLAKLSPLKLLLRTGQTVVECLLDLVVGVLRRDRQEYPYLQNYFYENTVEYAHNLGMIYEQYTRSTLRFEGN